MKIIKYIIAILAYLFLVYYVLNFVYWNNPIYGLGDLPYLFLAVVFAFLSSTRVFTYKITNRLISVFAFIIIFVSIFWFSFYSLKIGRKQSENNLLEVKVAIDKYYSKNKKYPKRLSELETQGFIKSIKRPIFLIPYGKYYFYTTKELNFDRLELHADNTICLAFITNDNIPSTFFDN
ncbi:MAG: hypothetical protein U0U67_05360 [Chitinophagales bacterium]